MKKSVEFIGLSIISIGEGRELGTAKDLVIDATNGQVAAIVVEDGKWYLGAKILPFDLIRGIGEYALTIENGSAVIPLTSVPEVEQFLEADVRIKGTKVLTKGGKMQGQVTELLIDEQSGKINACEITLVSGESALIPAERVITFGKEVLVILEEGEEAAPAAKIDSPPPAAPPEVKTTASSAPITTPSIDKTAVVPAPAVPATKEAIPDPVPAISAADAGQADAKTQNSEDLSKKFDEKHRKFVLGKKSIRRIEADNGELIVDQGGEITEEVIEKAKNTGKFIELTMSIAPAY